jgi:hypothetical protein
MFPTTPPNSYLALRKHHYGHYPDYDPTETALRQAWGFVQQYNEAFWHDGEHFQCVLYRQGERGWAFGFFETKSEDFEGFQQEWLQLRSNYPGEWQGPLQGSTFLPYRFITESDGSPIFPGEWRNQDHYGPWMDRLQPTSTTFYRSASRIDYQGVIAVSQPFVEGWEAQGFALQPIDLHPANLKDLHTMVHAIFAGNWGYEGLTLDQFAGWAGSISQSHGGKPWLFWVQMGAQKVGFAYLFLLNDGTLIFKTLGLLPEYQAQKMGNAVAGKLHQLAQKAGVKKCIYALVQADNRVNRMPDPDITVFRKYHSYSFA